ncbi:LysM peptidoglycan-binding domain-containing protein [Bradyrhizobium lablabi]|uniref:LysM peptidoglycan-binding domain-containing protein n=1 Tax=Bradyrhizobium lablabi TaxID=722472 RepID=UPI001BADFCC0|nr:LysM peptidoglycan-binding domain-containing protein [Bradyrhizobium lablabi]MBR1123497.1 LysM peptidoglycan-binding domain-containing protein [Bradyrhizobium lablabi]
MIALTTSRTIPALAALAAACGLTVVVVIQNLQREPPVETKVASSGPAALTPASAKPEPAALESAQAQANALIAGLGGSPALPKGDAGEPTFDVARVEPTGEAVIAGRSTPGATVELLRNGELHDRAVADQSGQFVIVPSSRLPSGNYDLTLRSREPNGKQSISKQSVAVAIEPRSTDRPVVALMTPDKPTVVLSQPDPQKLTPGTVVAEAVEIEPGGKFHASGRARPGGTVRLYLNEAFIASATAAADGRFAFTINEGISSGNYRVRLDEVDPKSGAVHARAEVPFNVPTGDITGSSATARVAAAKQPAIAAAQQPQLAAAGTTVLSDQGSPAAVVVPKVLTTKVSRGDSLWRISQLNYGLGTRYATIYKANREQIRNPNLIYPGQVFVIPSGDAHR